jgi:hypothetical protein
MSKNSTVVLSEGYTFEIFSNRRIVVESKGLGDEELILIAGAYALHREKKKYSGRPNNGIWQRCSNPECKMVVYVNKSWAAIKKGSYCSHSCHRKVSWAQKKQLSGNKVVPIEDNFQMELLTSNIREMACWILGAVSQKDPEMIKRLKLLLKASDERTKSVLREILREIPGGRPAYPAANKIIKSYIQSKEGKDLRIPIQKLIGILFFIPAGL